MTFHRNMIMEPISKKKKKKEKTLHHFQPEKKS